MDWQAWLGWMVAAVVAAASWAWRNRQRMLIWAGEAVSFAEKFYHGVDNTILEDEAVRYFHAQWPQVPEVLVRLAVRELCRRRKAGAAALTTPANGSKGGFAINLGKFARSLFHDVNPSEIIGDLVARELKAKPLGAGCVVKRAAVLTLWGRRYVVDLVARVEEDVP